MSNLVQQARHDSSPDGVAFAEVEEQRAHPKCPSQQFHPPVELHCCQLQVHHSERANCELAVDIAVLQ